MNQYNQYLIGMPLKSGLFIKIILLITSLTTISHAAKITQQDCDGEKSTCCSATGFAGVPSMWVKEESCPKGMADDATCIEQPGCVRSVLNIKS
jgi:hypothetical protein